MLRSAWCRLAAVALIACAGLLIPTSRSQAGWSACGGVCPSTQCLDLQDYATGVCLINGNGYYWGYGTFYQCYDGKCTLQFGTCYLPDDVCPESECCFRGR